MSKSPSNDHSPSSPKYSRLSASGDDFDVSDADGSVTQPLRSDTGESDRDFSKLRRVADALPTSIWIITVIETCERFAYLGIAGPLQNYVQNASDDPLRPGGLGESSRYLVIRSMKRS